MKVRMLTLKERLKALKESCQSFDADWEFELKRIKTNNIRSGASKSPESKIPSNEKSNVVQSQKADSDQPETFPSKKKEKDISSSVQSCQKESTDQLTEKDKGESKEDINISKENKLENKTNSKKVFEDEIKSEINISKKSHQSVENTETTFLENEAKEQSDKKASKGSKTTEDQSISSGKESKTQKIQENIKTSTEPTACDQKQKKSKKSIETDKESTSLVSQKVPKESTSETPQTKIQITTTKPEDNITQKKSKLPETEQKVQKISFNSKIRAFETRSMSKSPKIEFPEKEPSKSLDTSTSKATQKPQVSKLNLTTKTFSNTNKDISSEASPSPGKVGKLKSAFLEKMSPSVKDQQEIKLKPVSKLKSSFLTDLGPKNIKKGAEKVPKNIKKEENEDSIKVKKTSETKPEPKKILPENESLKPTGVVEKSNAGHSIHNKAKMFLNMPLMGSLRPPKKEPPPQIEETPLEKSPVEEEQDEEYLEIYHTRLEIQKPRNRTKPSENYFNDLVSE